jgi:hypothetical protein
MPENRFSASKISPPAQMPQTVDSGGADEFTMPAEFGGLHGI